MKVLENRIPPGFLDMNRQALELGLEMGQEARKRGLPAQSWSLVSGLWF